MNDSTFTTPTEDRCLEDYVVGSVSEFGSIAVEEDDIIDFARRFDPQVFHTDPEAAKKSIYGGLIASGWHTASMMMRLIVDHYLPLTARSLGSPGIDELRWTKPVRPGDKLSVRVTVLEANRSRSKPDRGVLRSFVEVLNQNHEVVLTVKAVNFLLCREAPQQG
jgi:acyl dehydratase